MKGMLTFTGKSSSYRCNIVFRSRSGGLKSNSPLRCATPIPLPHRVDSLSRDSDVSPCLWCTTTKPHCYLAGFVHSRLYFIVEINAKLHSTLPDAAILFLYTVVPLRTNEHHSLI